MGQYLNPDNLGFASAVNSQIYVDKTGMLDYLNQVIGTEQRYVCVSRPRRFGKSIAARMAAAYYSRGCRSEALFSKYEIAHICDEIPAGRMGTPAEVAEAIALLAEAPIYLTGQIITMDGGWC